MDAGGGDAAVAVGDWAGGWLTAWGGAGVAFGVGVCFVVGVCVIVGVDFSVGGTGAVGSTDSGIGDGAVSCDSFGALFCA